MLLEQGSNIVFSEDLDKARVRLVTSFKRELILNYIKASLSQREVGNNKLYDFLNKNLYAKQAMVLSFSIDPTAKDLIASIKNISIS